ncbi:hypothetical protein H696_01011 [Fonticula alba]|uniref:Growth factor receptor domain-containing protein n=1 Tax=Fonticula alba TaxID=691883 RepID=A0A058ZIZ1_FONAL|nr:hypothetical protein H696_01011 [Fonticula alba]KCV73472.1 hypothetical protein H696_01011 [Fonticula alba]|eukprot:XP_009493173.1 hypothetical protein H696_01011 [Fonticula alba]
MEPRRRSIASAMAFGLALGAVLLAACLGPTLATTCQAPVPSTDSSGDGTPPASIARLETAKHASDATSAACPPMWSYSACSNRCDYCGPECASCQFTSNICQMSCHSCNSGYFLHNSECIRYCPQGYYENASARMCSPCQAPCVTCSKSMDACLSCSTGLLHVDAYACVSVCPPFSRQEGTRCRSCPDKCEVCDAPVAGPADQSLDSIALTSSAVDHCDRCMRGYFLLHGAECVEKCPEGFFPDHTDTGSICAPCHAACETCTGPSADECIPPRKSPESSPKEKPKWGLVIGLSVGLGIVALLGSALTSMVIARGRKPHFSLRQVLSEYSFSSSTTSPLKSLPSSRRGSSSSNQISSSSLLSEHEQLYI